MNNLNSISDFGNPNGGSMLSPDKVQRLQDIDRQIENVRKQKVEVDEALKEIQQKELSYKVLAKIRKQKEITEEERLNDVKRQCATEKENIKKLKVRLYVVENDLQKNKQTLKKEMEENQRIQNEILKEEQNKKYAQHLKQELIPSISSLPSQLDLLQNNSNPFLPTQSTYIKNDLHPNQQIKAQNKQQSTINQLMGTNNQNYSLGNQLMQSQSYFSSAKKQPHSDYLGDNNNVVNRQQINYSQHGGYNMLQSSTYTFDSTKRDMLASYYPGGNNINQFQQRQENKKGSMRILGTVLVETFLTIYIFIPLWVIYGIIRLFILKGQDFGINLKMVISNLISCIITAFTLIESQKEYTIIELLFLNPFIFQVTQVFICSYIKQIHLDDTELTWRSFFFSFKNGIFSLCYQIENQGIRFDIPRDERSWKEEVKYLLKMINEKYDKQKFNYFYERYQSYENSNPNQLFHPIDELIPNKMLEDNKQMLIYHILLQIPIVIKMLLFASFIHHNNQFTSNAIFRVIIITLFYCNLCYNFAVVLGNYDLKRKIILLLNLNQAMIFHEKDCDYGKKIDITNSNSISTWNNSKQIRLEVCYCFFMVVILFASMICLSAFLEFDYLFGKQSVFMNPLMIFSNITDIILLLIIILSRVYYSSQYNSLYDKVQKLVEQIQNAVKDMIIDFDYQFLFFKENIKYFQSLVKEYFNQTNQQIKNQDQQKKHILVLQDLLIQKIRFIQEYYFKQKQGETFNGRSWYTTKPQIPEMYDLQKSIFKNVYDSFKKANNEIKANIDDLQYKIFNLVQIDFTTFIGALLVPLLPLLPQILIVIVNYYKDSV